MKLFIKIPSAHSKVYIKIPSCAFDMAFADDSIIYNTNIFDYLVVESTDTLRIRSFTNMKPQWIKDT